MRWAKRFNNWYGQQRFPVPGQRIIRTVIAIWICFMIFLLRGKPGYVIFSAVAAMGGMQPYTKDMLPMAMKRVAGTVIGAFWGLLLLLVEINVLQNKVSLEVLHYFLIAFGVGIVIYTTVLLRVSDWTYFSAVTFMSVTITHLADANPYIYAWNRLVETLIGVFVAEIVNRIQLPRKRETDTLFVSSIGNSLLGENDQLSSYSKVELNRLIEDGAKYTVSTVQTQARIREMLPGVNLRYPVITMDGAALYDMNSLEYLRCFPMPPDHAKRVMDWLTEREVHFFSTSVFENLLVIHYAELGNPAMREAFEARRRSPYRNFIRSPLYVYNNVLYVHAAIEDDRIDEIIEALQAEPWAEEHRVVKAECETAGYQYLKIYDRRASREAMLKELEEIMGTKWTVTLGGVPGKYDVYIKNANRDEMVKALKKMFEPVSFQNLKSMIRM
ncbi:MAG: hypothetical protein E7240_01690 [Lachnospiraceae bacterium]|nr:hypothetical protein [Lachnospiraceae bacterium]